MEALTVFLFQLCELFFGQSRPWNPLNQQNTAAIGIGESRRQLRFDPHIGIVWMDHEQMHAASRQIIKSDDAIETVINFTADHHMLIPPLQLIRIFGVLPLASIKS